jgi:predicted RNA-binding protein YlxR (DUF448 family)
VLDPEELIRFVFAPDGTIVPDVGRRLPGRGVWISCSRSAVAAAQKSGAFARSLRRSVATAPDLANVVERLLLRRAIDALSLANKAGLAVAGFTKVEALIASRECAALLHASDAADDGVGKLDRRLRAVWRSLGNEEEPRIVTALSSEELSLAMGRSNVVHAALRIGGAASNFLTDVGRLQRYRAAPDASAKSLGSGAKAEQV